MLVLNSNTYYHYTETTQLVVGVQNKVEERRKILGSGLLYSLASVGASILVFPYFFYKGLVFRKRRKALENEFRDVDTAVLDSNEDYLTYKVIQRYYKTHEVRIKKILEYDNGSGPLRFYMRELKALSNSVIKVHNKVSKQLAEQFNQPKHKIPGTSSFVHLNESEKWEQRSSVYSYWM